MAYLQPSGNVSKAAAEWRMAQSCAADIDVAMAVKREAHQKKHHRAVEAEKFNVGNEITRDFLLCWKILSWHHRIIIGGDSALNPIVVQCK